MRVHLTGSLLLPWATLALAACGAPQTTMEAVAKDFDEHVMEIQGEFDTHATKAAAAADVSGIAGLETPHRTTALELLKKLDERVEHMGMCTNASKASPDLMICEEAMAKIKTAAETHASAMAGIAGLTEARAAEELHHKEMKEQLALMKSHIDSLKSSAATYLCTAASMGSGH